MIGTASAPSSQNGRLEASQVGPRSQMKGTCTIAASGIQCASAGIGSVPTAGRPAAHVDEAPDVRDREAVPGRQRARHGHVVDGVWVARLRERQGRRHARKEPRHEQSRRDTERCGHPGEPRAARRSGGRKAFDAAPSWTTRSRLVPACEDRDAQDPEQAALTRPATLRNHALRRPATIHR